MVEFCKLLIVALSLLGASAQKLDESYGNDSINIPACGGDCDNDQQCAGSLKCLQRSAGENVPGCDNSNTLFGPNGSRKTIDFCYKPTSTNTGTNTASTNTGTNTGCSGGRQPKVVVRDTKGGVVKSRKCTSGAQEYSYSNLGLKSQNGDYEIVHVGGSTNMSPGSLTNSKPIDESLMKGQGFSLIGVKGHRDKSSELWVRKNSGQRRLTITKKSFDTPWSVTVLDGSAITLKPDSFKVNGWCSGSTKDMDSQGNGWMSFGKYVPSGEGATIAAIFFDDPVEVTNANGGQILFKVFKSIGDGDGLATVLYQAGQRIPDRLLTRDHEGPDGAEEVCTVAVKVNLCGAGRSLDQGPDLDKDVTSCTGKESAYCPRLKKILSRVCQTESNKKPSYMSSDLLRCPTCWRW
jgi:hypothetical protein